MQTHEWEELLSEWADSWELRDAYADGARQLLEEGSLIGTINMHITHVHEEVVAAAPAAVAEVVRLRREIEALRKAWDASATLYVKRALAHPTSQRYDILSETHTRIAYELARILEGEA